MLSMIVAASENHVIGKEGSLPWDLPRDLRYFKSVTSGHPILMGRKTYESIGRPLPNRENIVLTSNQAFDAPGCTVVHSIDDLTPDYTDEVFVIGGAQLYAALLPQCRKLYLTRVHAEVEGDTYLPDINFEQWRLISEERVEADEDNAHALTFLIYERLST